MTKLVFPPLEEADEDGLLGVSRALSVDDLLDAYSKGIFPWPWTEESIAWFAPPQRAVLFFDQLRINRSLKRAQLSSNFEIQKNYDFRSIINGCRNSQNRKNQKGTWITNQMVESYCKLFELGFAECFGSYINGELVGGIYGVKFGNYFSAESMFYTKPNASKIALLNCIDSLKSEGLHWIDCQVINSVTASLGAKEIPRNQFTELLSKTILKRK